MTREEAKKLLPIIQAYADGEEIEFRYNALTPWSTLHTPNFGVLTDSEYRIKPKPRKFWIDLSSNLTRPIIGGDIYTAYASINCHRKDAPQKANCIYVREVLPEDEK